VGNPIAAVDFKANTVKISGDNPGANPDVASLLLAMRERPEFLRLRVVGAGLDYPNVTAALADIKSFKGKARVYGEDDLKDFEYAVLKDVGDHTWYHATRESVLDGIRQKGLLPSGNAQGEGWTQFNLHLQKAVYLTADLEYAKNIASTLAERFGESAVVLQVNHKFEPDRIVIDEDTLRNSYDGMVMKDAFDPRWPSFVSSLVDSIQSIGYAGVIPVQALRVVWRQTPDVATEDTFEDGAGLPVDEPLVRVAMPMPTGLPEGWRVTWDEDADIGLIELKLLDTARKAEATLTLERVEAGRGKARMGEVWQVSEVRAKNRGSGWGAFLRMYALRKLSSRGAYVQSDSSVSESGQRFWSKLYETAQNPISGVERVPVDRRVMRNMNDRDQATREQFFRGLTLGPDGKVTNMPLVETPDVQARYRLKGAGLGLGLPALVTALGLMGAPGDGDVVRSSGGSGGSSDGSVGASTEAQRKQTYAALVDQVARAEGVDPDVIHAMIRAESRYQHNVSSDKGAVGLMQTTPITAKQMGVPPPTTPEESVQLGVRYMRYLLRMFRGDLELALAAYNRGPTAVKESLAARGRPPHTPETVNYVRRVLRALGQLPRHYTDAEIERHRPL
jgi:hypothetical protein